MNDVDRKLADSLRQTFRGMVSTVTIVSTERGKSRFGMVATSVMSLSLEPPSLVVGVNRSASIHDPLVERGVFAINVLSSSDASIARGFSFGSGEHRFAFGPWSSCRSETDGLKDIPYLVNAQSAIFCRVRDVQSAGTHSLIVGDVIDVLRSDLTEPLVYCSGSYGSFASLADEFPLQHVEITEVVRRLAVGAMAG